MTHLFFCLIILLSAIGYSHGMNTQMDERKFRFSCFCEYNYLLYENRQCTKILVEFPQIGCVLDTGGWGSNERDGTRYGLYTYTPPIQNDDNSFTVAQDKTKKYSLFCNPNYGEKGNRILTFKKDKKENYLLETLTLRKEDCPFEIRFYPLTGHIIDNESLETLLPFSISLVEKDLTVGLEAVRFTHNKSSVYANPRLQFKRPQSFSISETEAISIESYERGNEVLEERDEDNNEITHIIQ